MPLFDRYVGIDYSGRARPGDPVPGLRVFVAERGTPPQPQPPATPGRGNWDRKGLAAWLLQTLQEGPRTVVCIDHAFSYPQGAMEGVSSWYEFLDRFEERWPTREKAVSDCPEWASLEHRPVRDDGDDLRLTDRWTQTAMSVFKGWEGNGPNVFYSTHAGIPWLRWLRAQAAGRVHFWPFDEFELPAEKSVIAEGYPRLFRGRYKKETDLKRLTDDERDAYLLCRWLQNRDENDLLAPYFCPPLTRTEAERARLEGWILGVM